MRCVICKTTTTAGEPREHIIPEGLGNTVHILQRGLVCGKCNNYFASKVEQPFLELSEIVKLRFEQAVTNKKGRVPSITGILLDPIMPVELMRDADTGLMAVSFSEEAVRAVTTFERGQIIIPMSKLVTPGPITSRFVGKVALEALAYRIQDNEAFLDEMIDNMQLDVLRRHVRLGDIPDWPISVRRLRCQQRLD